MFKEFKIHANFNERTGYGIHASRFFPELEKIRDSRASSTDSGEVNISLLDVVTASHIGERLPKPSILYTVWESTEYPPEFMNKIALYDQLWVPSEWQRSCSIAQGIPEEFVKVVPEGVDIDTYKPSGRVRKNKIFTFIHVGQWQPRKSTLEICQSFIKAFPDNEDVRLILMADTLYPSDKYESTEERLEAYDVNDPRIIPVHFEESRDKYVKMLQDSDCFVSCSRSEGWGLPMIEAAACGTPTIVANFGGSTEYANRLINVRIKELKKPHGIFGDWDVPGYWGEPDYDHLVECMKYVYENKKECKEKALETAKYIHENFSWEAAAEKAYKVISDISIEEPPEDRIRTYARELGYSITDMKKDSIAICIDCHPTTQERLDTLIETINQVRFTGYPIIVTSHIALPPAVVELCDFYIYDTKDILSGEDRPIYQRRKGDGTVESARASIPCHALAGHNNKRNGIDFCRGRFEWIYFISSDTEFDFHEWLRLVRASDKDIITTHWDDNPHTFGGQVIAAKTEAIDKMYRRFIGWADYAEYFGADRFCAEIGYYKLANDTVGIENVEFLDIPLGNRFDQVDRDAWEDDMFDCHFVEGPYLNIVGLSRREYDVEYSTPENGVYYTTKQTPGMWSRPAIKYYKDWTVTAKLNGEIKFQHTIDLKGKRVLISMGSKALGDTIAWMPYIEEFRKKHDCHVIMSGWWQEIFDYPEIEMVKPGAHVENVYASYMVGCYDNQLDLNVEDWRLTPLQKVAADILGLDYVPLKAKLKIPERPKPKNKYICFSEYSTMQNKQWNRNGAWQKVIDKLSKNYECVSISAEQSNLNNVTYHNSQSIQNTIADVANCEFYVGLNHGPSWIAYALGKPCVMITGVSEEWNDFPNPYRIEVGVCKPGCFNDPTYKIDRGWAWCPRNKDFACTREITEDMVMDTIKRLEKDHAIKKGKVKKDNSFKHTGVDSKRATA